MESFSEASSLAVGDAERMWDVMVEEQPLTRLPLTLLPLPFQGWTPLMCAATHGHIEMCDLLLDFGADVNARKNFSVCPLLPSSPPQRPLPRHNR